MSSARPLRILLDVNVFVNRTLSRAFGRTGTTSQKLVEAMLDGNLGGHSAQLVLSLAMLASFRGVLLRLGASPETIDAANRALLDLTQEGPERLDPFLLLDSSDAPFALRDREDAGVLATAFAARADLLITDNLADFERRECKIVKTSRARHADGALRQLSCQFLRGADGHIVIVAHPLDVVERATRGRSILFEDLA